MRLVHAIRAFWRVLTNGYPRMTVDRDTGAIYVYLQPGDQHRTIEVDPFPDEIMVDVDAEGRTLGVEILSLVS